MPYIVAGLGNPGEEYKDTRHNTGRILVGEIAKALSADEFSFDKKSNSLIAEAKIPKAKDGKVLLVLPETFMNKSGNAVSFFVKNPKSAEKLIVIYDDFNLPLGKVRISYNRSSGGHNGLESVIKAIKTEAFLRIRIGLSPANSKGIAKVPHGEDKIEKFILGKFRDAELKEIKKVSKKVVEAVETIIKESKEKAMSIYNQG